MATIGNTHACWTCPPTPKPPSEYVIFGATGSGFPWCGTLHIQAAQNHDVYTLETRTLHRDHDYRTYTRHESVQFLPLPSPVLALDFGHPRFPRGRFSDSRPKGWSPHCFRYLYNALDFSVSVPHLREAGLLFFDQASAVAADVRQHHPHSHPNVLPTGGTLAGVWIELHRPVCPGIGPDRTRNRGGVGWSNESPFLFCVACSQPKTRRGVRQVASLWDTTHQVGQASYSRDAFSSYSAVGQASREARRSGHVGRLGAYG